MPLFEAMRVTGPSWMPQIVLASVDGATIAVQIESTDDPVPHAFLIGASSLEPLPDLFKGLPRTINETTSPGLVTNLRGRYPGELTAEVLYPGDRDGYTVEYKQNGTRWNKQPEPWRTWTSDFSRAYYLGGMVSQVALPDGTLLYERLAEGDAPYEFAFSKRGYKSWKPVAAKKENACVVQLTGHVALAWAGKESLLGLGQKCGDALLEYPPSQWDVNTVHKDQPLAVETWAVGSNSPSSIATLPGSTPLDHQVRPEFFLHQDEIWVLAGTVDEQGRPKSYLARRRGSEWVSASIGLPHGFVRLHAWGDRMLASRTFYTEPTKLYRFEKDAWIPVGEAEFERLTPAPDGALWFHGEGPKVTRLDPTSFKLTESVIPLSASGVRVEQLSWLNGELLVLARMEAGVLAGGRPDEVSWVLLREQQTLAIASTSVEGSASNAIGVTRALTQNCDRPFVVLYRLGKLAATDYDFPVTRAALKGKKQFERAEFLETEDRGRRYLIARVATVLEAQQLATDIQRSVAGSSPRLLCGEPARVLRRIQIDWKTGDLVH